MVDFVKGTFRFGAEFIANGEIEKNGTFFEFNFLYFWIQNSIWKFKLSENVQSIVNC